MHLLAEIVSPAWKSSLARLLALLAGLAAVGCAGQQKAQLKTATVPVVCAPTANAAPLLGSHYVVPGSTLPQAYSATAVVVTDSNNPRNCSPQSKLLGGSVVLKATQFGHAPVNSEPGCLAAKGVGFNPQNVAVQFQLPATGMWSISKQSISPWWKQADMTADPNCHRILFVSLKPGAQRVFSGNPEVRFTLENYYETELRNVTAEFTTDARNRILGRISLPKIKGLGSLRAALNITGPLPPVGTKIFGRVSAQATLHGRVIRGSNPVVLEVTDRKCPCRLW